MSDIRYITAGATAGTTNKDDAHLGAQGTRDGAIYTADWFFARAAQGQMFVANAGTGTTPITCGAGSINTAEPDLHIDVPSGTTLVLAELVIYAENFGTKAIVEVMASYGTGGSAGTDTAVTPVNLRSDAPSTSNCTVGAASDADATYTTTNVVEFLRDGQHEALDVLSSDDDSTYPARKFVWSYKTASYPVILVGAAQLQAFVAAQASTAFITAVWAEVTSTNFAS